MPSTTVAGPRVASPAALDVRQRSSRMRDGPWRQLRCRWPVRSSESTFSPMAEMTRSQGISMSLAGGDGAAAAGSIGLAQLHDVPAAACRRPASTGAASSTKLTPSSMASLQLMLVSGHVLLRTAVDDGGGRGAHALCNAGSVHRGVASADNDDMTPLRHGLTLRLHFLHPADDACDIAFDAQLASLPSADWRIRMWV